MSYDIKKIMNAINDTDFTNVNSYDFDVFMRNNILINMDKYPIEIESSRLSGIRLSKILHIPNRLIKDIIVINLNNFFPRSMINIGHIINFSHPEFLNVYNELFKTYLNRGNLLQDTVSATKLKEFINKIPNYITEQYTLLVDNSWNIFIDLIHQRLTTLTTLGDCEYYDTDTIYFKEDVNIEHIKYYCNLFGLTYAKTHWEYAIFNDIGKFICFNSNEIEIEDHNI